MSADHPQDPVDRFSAGRIPRSPQPAGSPQEPVVCGEPVHRILWAAEILRACPQDPAGEILPAAEISLSLRPSGYQTGNRNTPETLGRMRAQLAISHAGGW
jgi:hypothetical protein